MDAVRALSLLAATISMGLVAGVFGLYAHTIVITIAVNGPLNDAIKGGCLAWALVLYGRSTA